MSRPASVFLATWVWMGLSIVEPVFSTEQSTQPAPVLAPGQTLRDLRSYLLRRAPKFIAPSDPNEWLSQADQIREQVLKNVVFRGVPQQWQDGPVRVVWQETLPGKGYKIRKLRYEAVPGLWIGALLYEPESLPGKVPVVLNPNGHVGKPGMTIDYKQARCINLAKRGMLALNYEWIGMGQLNSPGYAHGNAAHLDLCGRAGVSVFYQSLKRGLDVLLSHPSADPERTAVTGLSGGGWQTIVFSSLDMRVKLCAPNAGYSGIERRIWETRDIGDREQNPPDLVAIADYPVLTALLAPRPALLIYNADDDCCFYAATARLSVFEPVLPVYEMLGVGVHFALHVNSDPGTHNYLVDNRQAFYRFINRHFLPPEQRKDEEIPCEDEIRKPEELKIEYPPDNADFYSLAAEAMRDRPAAKRPVEDEIAGKQWSDKTRDALAKVVRPDLTLRDNPVVTSLSASTMPVGQTPGTSSHLRLGRQWTLPMVEYTPTKDTPTVCHLIIADGGIGKTCEIAAKALGHGERVIVADILFTGECVPGITGTWQFAQMIDAVGARPLGIQAGQLDAIIEHLSRRYPGETLHVTALGRVSGLAALTTVALTPGRVARLTLQDMLPSLKDLIAKKTPWNEAPSLFCFGLLEVTDVPELIELAKPTQVSMQ
ncbi:MAG: alpha/beta hydrolase family protein [Phycisphaerae bacterium]